MKFVASELRIDHVDAIILYQDEDRAKAKQFLKRISTELVTKNKQKYESYKVGESRESF